MEENNTQPTAPTQSPPPAPTNPAPQTNQGMSHDTKTLIVILLLVFVYWIGLIFMWAWMKTWPKWLKILITLPVFLSILFILFFLYVIFKNPSQITYNNERLANEQPVLVSPTETQDQPTPTSSQEILGMKIKNALESKSYDDLIPYMAESVQFEIEASEGVPAGTPEETVTNLSYLDTATAPWNFDQEDPTIDAIKTEYPDEYGPLYIGISENDFLVAFGYDEDGKIDVIKVAGTYKLLVTQ